MEHTDLLIVGAGAAGIAAAKGAYEAGCTSITLVDRKEAMGGVLLQCAHCGFGKQLTGPEYAAQLGKAFPKDIAFVPSTTVLRVSSDKIARLSGGKQLHFHQLILATGCREIPMGALPIAGTRPKGIYTAGQLQEMVNLHQFRPEGPAVILGSGDLGLIMANHLSDQGLYVTLVEQKSSCTGMARNRVCLKKPLVSLQCGTTITEVLGEETIEGCITQTGTVLPCKTLVIAVGLRPERTLAEHLGNPPWLHLCGNCDRIHPMVETVIGQGKQAGIAAYETMRGTL